MSVSSKTGARWVEVGLVVVVVLGAFCGLVSSKLVSSEVRSRAYRDYVVGGWKDNANDSLARWVYVCSSCDYPYSDGCEYFIAWTRPGSATNLTSFARSVRLRATIDGSLLKSNIEDQELNLEGHYDTLCTEEERLDDDDNRPWRTKTFKMILKKPSIDWGDNVTWRGELDGEPWTWTNRYFSEEPGPSACMRPITLQPPIVTGRWQRTTSSGDTVMLNICPDGEGYWQQSYSGEGGKLVGEYHTDDTIWIGDILYDKLYNRTKEDELDSRNYRSGALILSQVGARVLSSVQTNHLGQWVESRTFNYIGVPEDCSGNFNSLSFHILCICAVLHALFWATHK